MPTDRRFTGQRAETGMGSLYDSTPVSSDLIFTSIKPQGSLEARQAWLSSNEIPPNNGA